MYSPGEEYEIFGRSAPAMEPNHFAKHHCYNCSQVDDVLRIDIFRGILSVAQGGTRDPKLWSTIVVDTTLWPSCRVSLGTLLSLLKSSLARNQIHSLTIQVAVSEAGRNVDLWFNLRSPGNYLSSVSAPGKTRTLGNWRRVNVFRGAPRFKDVVYGGRFENTPELPWTQITAFTHVVDEGHNSAAELSKLKFFPNISSFIFEADLATVSAHISWSSIASDRSRKISSAEFSNLSLSLRRKLHSEASYL
ncbi:hypothetical protein B0H19DRAFT_1224390 [Mycena capillaripes]|nr:hypothetical protein B0H19DRAFT_1224390 [Mycena capillaripes]